MNSRRYIKSYPGYQVEFDQNYMEKMEKLLVVDSIKSQPDCLYGFVDEAGDHHLARDHHLFAVSGCAFVGQLDQQYIDTEWHKLRRDVFKVKEGSPYKSKRHLGKVKNEGLEKISLMLSEPDLKFFSSYITCGAVVDNKCVIVDSLLETVGQIAMELFPMPAERDEWYFDHSEKLLVTYMTGAEQIRYPAKTQYGGSYLVRQSSLLPAMEVADLVNFVVGDRIRSAVKKRPFRYEALWKTMFSDQTKGRCGEMLGIVGPVWIPSGSRSRTR